MSREVGFLPSSPNTAVVIDSPMTDAIPLCVCLSCVCLWLPAVSLTLHLCLVWVCTQAVRSGSACTYTHSKHTHTPTSTHRVSVCAPSIKTQTSVVFQPHTQISLSSFTFSHLVNTLSSPWSKRFLQTTSRHNETFFKSQISPIYVNVITCCLKQHELYDANYEKHTEIIQFSKI